MVHGVLFDEFLGRPRGTSLICRDSRWEIAWCAKLSRSQWCSLVGSNVNSPKSRVSLFVDNKGRSTSPSIDDLLRAFYSVEVYLFGRLKGFPVKLTQVMPLLSFKIGLQQNFKVPDSHSDSCAKLSWCNSWWNSQLEKQTVLWRETWKPILTNPACLMESSSHLEDCSAADDERLHTVLPKESDSSNQKDWSGANGRP